MSIIKNVQTLTRSFQQDTSGNVVLATALLVPAIFLSAGVAVDYTRMAATKSKLDAALDSAVLAVGNDLSKGLANTKNAEEKFGVVFKTNFIGLTGGNVPYEITNFNMDKKTGEISASVKSSIDASVTRIAGYETLEISSNSAAIFEQTDTEVAIMLDITGSMRSNNKIGSLKTAAKSAVDILLSDTNKNSTRVGLVPYASSVNVGNDIARKVTRDNNTVAAASSFNPHTNNVRPLNIKCVTERGGIHASNDTSYDYAPVGSDYRTVNGGMWGKERLSCPVSQVTPLTNKRNTLKNKINGMKATGYTAGHIGVAWSYYMLSDKWGKDVWGSSAAKPYSNKVNKIAIIMTDGSFNTAYNGVGGSPFGTQKTKSSNLARDLCADMKAAKAGNPGITIYSVAFEAPKDAQKLLKDCANEDTATQTFYYAADNGAELKAAFEDIAKSIQTLRLSR